MAFGRLAVDIFPLHYNISLCVDLDKFSFTGVVDVELQIDKTTSQVSLHSDKLIVNKVLIDSNAASFTYIKEQTILLLTAGTELNVGKHQLSIEYEGVLNDNLCGFYRSKQTFNGKSYYLASTQFEPTDARKAFPCWDEPSFKATFDVNITAKNYYTILSNMPETSRVVCTDDDSLVTVYFDRTPKVSTYLIAFVVGYFDYLETISNNNVKIRVYTTPGQSAKGKFALDTASKALTYFESYFDCRYPLSKLDLIAIPDFAQGAMENWGLIAYREVALLLDENESSPAAYQNVARTISHEIAHQWFGNLVTMEWWTDLWLNEGFARWIENVGVDYLYPEYNIWENFIVFAFTGALNADSLESSHPIRTIITHPSEIEEIFDFITYAKGASVIRMLDNYMGKEKFMEGLQKYIKKYSYSNADNKALWDCMDEAFGTKLHISSLMDAWTNQAGYPLITVSLGSNNAVKFVQKRFLVNGKQSTGDQCWMVPIVLSRIDDPSGKPVHKFLLEKEEEEIVLPSSCPAISELRLNANLYGFYRVHIEIPAMESNLISHLSQLNSIDRLSVGNDLFALCRSLKVSVIHYLDLLWNGYRGKEEQYIVWADIFGNLYCVNLIVQHISDKCVQAYDKYIIDLLKAVFVTLGWEKKESDAHMDKLLRSLAIRVLGRRGDKEVLQGARERFEDHYNGVKSIDADIRAAVYSVVLYNGTKVELAKAIDLIKRTDVVEEKTRLLYNLGQINDDIDDLLKMFMDESFVRSQDFAFALSGCCARKANHMKAWNFAKDNWKDVVSRIPETKHPYFIKSMNNSFCAKERADDLRTFIASQDLVKCAMAVDQAIETIETNASFLEFNRAALIGWFRG